ncbi:MAG: tRNA (adenosine(37)-N6)-threonylcarbamoyltransferase complex transferase subunit TsaD [Candidatus Gracilibacteria bacterium]|nr:tRNA (adenosine(37)-N6)-threonylcarbamoyltransferase complex transferase subunit TsaD [Candidatus Gracilibacteria bacterium]
MLILAIETSCDDTSVALFENDNLLFMDTASQIKIHAKTGGVIPEIAAREHANNIFKVLDKVLKNHYPNEENLTIFKKINYIAVTTNPGLIPSLLTGITVAKTISKTLNIPLIEINHIEAHIFSNFIERKKEDITFPLTCLTVSGGHNEIYYMKNMYEFEKIGGTQDDSAGEAFDKVAKMMGLTYPGGPIISDLADQYINSHKEEKKSKNYNLFPRSWLDKEKLDFSFSGLKSSVKREIDKRIEKNGSLTDLDRQEISYEFQEATIEVLGTKLVNSSFKYKTKNIMLAGGVSANNRLKEFIKSLIINSDINFIYPIKNIYSMDNAAMVGINAYYKIQKN